MRSRAESFSKRAAPLAGGQEGGSLPALRLDNSQGQAQGPARCPPSLPRYNRWLCSIKRMRGTNPAAVNLLNGLIAKLSGRCGDDGYRTPLHTSPTSWKKHRTQYFSAKGSATSLLPF